MDHVVLRGLPVEYELLGEGEPVVLLHARPFVRWYRPLIPALQGRAVLRYQRPTPDDPSFGIEDDAALCAGLLAHVGIERPHLIGHSYGGIVALELARQRAVDARSLALLEPATTGLYPPEDAAPRLAPILAAARADGPEAAMDVFLRMVCGDDGRERLDRLVPGAVDDAMDNAPGFFAVELPAVIRWSFTPADAARIDRPVLNVLGSESSPRFAEGAAILQSWFPTAERCLLPGLNHLLMAQEPAVMAERLEQFWRSA